MSLHQNTEDKSADGGPLSNAEHINGKHGWDLDRVMGKTRKLITGWARWEKLDQVHWPGIKWAGPSQNGHTSMGSTWIICRYNGISVMHGHGLECTSYKRAYVAALSWSYLSRWFWVNRAEHKGAREVSQWFNKFTRHLASVPHVGPRGKSSVTKSLWKSTGPYRLPYGPQQLLVGQSEQFISCWARLIWENGRASSYLYR